MRHRNPKSRGILEASVSQSAPPIQQLRKKAAGDIALTAASFQALAAMLLTPTDEDGWLTISIKELEAITRRSRNAIRQAILLLETRGYILIAPQRKPGTLGQSRRFMVMYEGAEYEQS